jgi:hypothetical protein
MEAARRRVGLPILHQSDTVTSRTSTDPFRIARRRP